MKDCTAPACPEVGPGLPAPLSPVSDQQTGSVLIYNFYSSSPSNPGVENTRINLTNADPGRTAFVHLFFVDGSTCAVADSTVCLTPNQTVSLEASDIDPGVSGYVVAVAVDRVSGCPIRFNSLMGDAYVKLSTGHAANLGAEAFPALKDNPAACDGSATTATLAFNGTGYGLVPRVVTLDSLPSVADGNSTLLILNRVGGNLTANAESLGSVFGLLYDDLEHSYSFSFRGGCQFRQVLSSTFPRTTPRLNQVVQAGHTGWMKLSAVEDVGLLGASLNFTPRAGSSPTAYSQGHNLHELTFTASTTITIPVSPPGC